MKKKRYGTGGGPRSNTAAPAPPEKPESAANPFTYNPSRAQWLPSEPRVTVAPALPMEQPAIAPAYRPPRLPRSTRQERYEEIYPPFRKFITVREEDR